MEDAFVEGMLMDTYVTYLQVNSMNSELTYSVTKVTVLTLPKNDSLPLLEYGGVSVAVILALGIFVGILLDKITAILKSSK